MYPSDETARIILAMELTSEGFVPTQGKEDFDRDKIDGMAVAMSLPSGDAGAFDWRAAALRPVVLGPNGEVLGGHHRVVAAHLAGIDLWSIPRQVQRQPQVYRDALFRWDQVLPDV